jgi:hypothetical protein
MQYTELKRSAEKLTNFLQTHLSTDGFDSRTFYGEIFMAVACQYCDSDKKIIQDALQGHKNKLLLSLETKQHQEFHLYAYNFLEESNKMSLGEPNLHFKHTIRVKPTNWILLRGLSKIRYGNTLDRITWKFLLPIIIRYNQIDGQILDRGIGAMIRCDKQEKYKSDQYQAFMLVLLTDLFEQTKNAFYLQAFNKGLTSLLKQLTANGEVIRSGRGKNQIFGYASIIYALTWSITKQKKNEFIPILQNIFNYFQEFQNQDGSYPLVLKNNDDPSQWESYNNLFDYLPFTATMLFRSFSLTKNASL